MTLPNLSRLAPSSPTGVTINPDGSRTFTVEELATLTRLLGTPVPGLLPAPARSRRPPTRVLRDDNSSSEEDRPLASRRRRSPAPPAQRRPRAAQPHTLPELLTADQLATILGAIGGRDQSKRSACHDAIKWCNLNTEHQAACDGAIPDVWRDLAKRIFSIPEAERLPELVTPDGDNLIYLAYRDDSNPREAFTAMCRALALGDVLAKRFAMFAIGQYKQMLEREDVEMLRRQRLNFRHAASFRYLDEWQERAVNLFEGAPLSKMCKDMYKDGSVQGANFKDLVDLVFSATSSYLFSGDKNFKNLAEKEADEEPCSEEEEEEEERSDGSSDCSDNEPDPDRYGIGQEEAIYAIGKALGVYIVGLWKLRRNLNEEEEFIKGVRVQIAHAVDRVLYGPNAMVPTEYAEYNEFQEQLHDEDGVIFFDMFEN